MKKLLSVILALVMILSLSTVAFADTTTPSEPATYDDMETVTLTKEYKLTNAGTTSPAETFTFSALTCTDVKDAGVGVTKENAPVPTIGDVSYTAGDAGSANARKEITITLPKYEAVGVYTYTFTEIDGKTAGVTYRSEPITLVVTVIEQDGKVRVAAVHTEETGGTKSGKFENTYSAGSLAVKKEVTGNMGDKDKKFDVTVTFAAPEGKTVNEAIGYVEDGITKSIPTTAWEDGKASVKIALKHQETITFNNIPYGVTYTVVEDTYEGYTTTYSGENGTVGSASAEATITNDKGGNVDTGIVLDSMPYVLLLAVAAMGLALLLTKKRASRED